MNLCPGRRTALCFVLLAFSGCGVPIPDQLVSDFDFTNGALSFENFDDVTPAGKMTPALAVRLFGADVVCATQDSGGCVPNDLAQAFIDDVNATLHAGHSEGMALVTLLFHLKKLDPKDFGADTVAQLRFDNPALQAEIAYWSATQKVPAALTQERSFEAKEVMPFLAQVLKPGQAEAWRLAIAMRTDVGFRGGHALVPFGFFKDKEDGQYVLRVYDSNFPSKEQRLFIDTRANTWRYEGSPDAANPRPYAGDGENHNRLYFSPLTPRMGQLEAPFAESARGLSVSANGVTVLTEDEAGARVGIVDGQVFENGGLVRPGFASCMCQAPHQILNVTLTLDGGTGGKQTVKITNVGNFETDGGTVNITSPGLSTTVSGVHAGDTSGQSVTVDPAAKSVTYTPAGNSGEAATVTTTTKNANGSTTTVSVTVDSYSKGVTINTSDPSNVKVEVEGTGTMAKVTVTETSPTGEQKTSTTNFTTGAQGGSVTVDPQANTSTVVESTYVPPCANGVKDSNEPDVDCGQQCVFANTPGDPTKYCATGKACGGDGDCATRLCRSGRCREPGCDDGVKNLAETDVDCGGGTCSGCAQTRQCALDRDCQGGFTCSLGRCARPTSATLQVIGLGNGAQWNLDQTYLNGTFYPSFSIWGRPGGDFLVPFTATTYQLGGGTAPRGHENVSCSPVENPSSGSGDGGMPVLRCTVAYSRLSLYVKSSGCYGTPSFSYVVDGVPGSVSVPGEEWGSATVRLGNLTGSYSVTAGPTVFYTGSGMQKQETCTLQAPTSGVFDGSGSITVTANCACGPVPVIDAGTPDAGSPDAGPPDAGPPDAGPPDAGPPDAGPPDAGPPDGGPPDAGPPDAGPPDGGPPDAGPSGCTWDSDCGSNNCYCASNPGNCTGATGVCAGPRAAITALTNGTAASGTFTVPASGCSQVRVAAWGAGGGMAQVVIPFPDQAEGGAGGFVSGIVSVSPGDVFTAWVAAAGAPGVGIMGTEGIGSYAGTATNGGAADWTTPGSGGGGGLTSVQRTGSVTQTFSVPAGGGGTIGAMAAAAGDTGSGSAMTRAGTAGTSGGGGGGAGENGGAGGANAPGDPGAFGTLPGGLASQLGSGMNPAGTGLSDYGLCPSSAGSGMGDGHGCVILRCVAP